MYGGYSSGAPSAPPAQGNSYQTSQGYYQSNPYQQHQYNTPPPPNQGQLYNSRPQPQYQHPEQQGQPNLWGWFCAVDTDRSGRISCTEMQQALSNGFEKFNMQTVQMLMNLFDKSGTGQLSFEDFQKVFEFINQWAKIFQQFDSDRSGAISFMELKTALTNFGYRLSDRFYNIILSRFANSRNQEISFDNFIRICVVLNNVTQNFQSLDRNRSGVIQISYEQFVEILFTIL